MVLNAMLRICHRSARRINVDSMTVLRRYVESKIAINFHDVTTYFCNVISIGKKSTSFLHTLASLF